MRRVTDGGRLTTHVLDVALGRPAEGVAIELARLAPAPAEVLATAVTDADGRTGAPLLEAGALQAATYELRFAIGPYFAMRAPRPDDDDVPPFLDVVPVRFTVSDPGAHHHVPLLVTPWSYSTYRGS
jgi:hydroxyisourate hydrolase